MSGIYTHGMKMPTSCERCPMLDWDLDYIKCKVTDRHFKMTECWRAIRVPDCPLVPVPDHGRLIDADALTKQLEDGANQSIGQAHYTYSFASMYVRNAPAIIPAEEGAG